MCVIMKLAATVLIMYSTLSKPTNAESESADGNRNFLKLQELHDYEDNYRRQMYTKIQLMMNTSGASLSPMDEQSDNIPFSICYHTLGMTASTGARFGCTENMTISDIIGEEAPGAFSLCTGDCIIIRAIENGTSTITRRCSDEPCVASPHCTNARNGACRHCCSGHFCNRDVPSFMMEKQGNTACLGPRITTVMIAALASIATVILVP